MSKQSLVLASSSSFRKELLERLHLTFITDSPDINESLLLDESPEDFVRRLSLEKARKVASRHQDSLIIASDQCSVLNSNIHGKPGHHDAAVKQLLESSGQQVSFLTGLCVLDSKTGNYELALVPYYVHFRELTLEEIDRYLRLETPYNCAGSFKSEGLGVTLFKSMEGDDPSALIGLPLIRLCGILRSFGLELP
ncbi:Maf family protein [Leucothrix arctica]|uniref:7-methyl-GTP pyrophosphatase n=1 Tax=Leucothrix arctica TaxID=1481894 RepID=A0A317C9V5_9GAMM|nr:Maf family nucleotide pyrophosphatase [Leucothrix arctica]PWQ95316.1 septum formation inhibitor Maf [Leucothrix arctica]